MKDILKGAGLTLLICLSIIWFGWCLGQYASATMYTAQERPVWYCIEGKIYEKIDQVYVTVSPDRACLPVDKK